MKESLSNEKSRNDPTELDLLNWCRRFLPHHFRRPPSTMHRWLAAQLDQIRAADIPVCHAIQSETCDMGPRTDRPGIKLNLLAPRGSAKSTLVTLAFILRCAVENREPYIWIVSDTRHQAIAHLENIKDELADNLKLAKAYSFVTTDHRPQTTDKPRHRANQIRLPSGATIEAFGTGQRIRGRRRRSNRPTLIICDDLQNDGHIESARQRERSRAWFDSMLLKAGTKRTNIIHLATALHRDAIGPALVETPGWISKRVQAIERWPDHMDLWREWEEIYANVDLDNSAVKARQFYEDHRTEMDAGAVLLWPEEEDLYTLMCMRVEGGHTAFEREKQNVPINPDLCEWPEEYFDRPLWFDEWPANLRLRVIALDPSKGANSRTGDDSAFVLLGIDAAGILYVEADLARRPAPQIVADGVEHCRRFRADVLGIETNQFQELFAAEFAAAFAAGGLLQTSIEPLENTTNKLVRIRRLGPLLSQGRLRFRSHSRGTQRLVDQLRAFPLGDHDDGPDALEMAVRLADAWLTARQFTDGLGSRLRLSV
jgi:predicted phage terminase large subunit-like protein